MKAINEWLANAATGLNLYKATAGRLGLFKTMHAINSATQQLGWEVAEHMERFSRKAEAQKIRVRKRASK